MFLFLHPLLISAFKYVRKSTSNYSFFINLLNLLNFTRPGNNYFSETKSIKFDFFINELRSAGRKVLFGACRFCSKDIPHIWCRGYRNPRAGTCTNSKPDGQLWLVLVFLYHDKPWSLFVVFYLTLCLLQVLGCKLRIPKSMEWKQTSTVIYVTTDCRISDIIAK